MGKILGKIDIVRWSYLLLMINMSEVSLTRLSSKGQIVVPKSLREIMGLEEGEVFALFGEGDTIILKRLELPSDKEFKRLLDWGEKYAKTHGITRKQVLKAIEDHRKGS